MVIFWKLFFFCWQLWPCGSLCPASSPAKSFLTSRRVASRRYWPSRKKRSLWPAPTCCWPTKLTVDSTIKRILCWAPNSSVSPPSQLSQLRVDCSHCSAGYKLMFQSGGPIENMRDKNSDMKDCVITDLPDIDVLCLQQVWERYWASNLIAQLKMKYSHFIYGNSTILQWNSFCNWHSIESLTSVRCRRLQPRLQLLSFRQVFQQIFNFKKFNLI